ncbi:penicillin-binding protein 1A [Pseudohaliea rubra]|uniref:Penicillin-binding protein 1A n=1 Tax=Pseudohaliea rubra DSM 19751 TaxID=1265313 RepID=A0A095WZE9_9GAMM|nr:penicillin-binding protein 1A [Pseudohaliea rubra]KGE04004.1 Multimodular transpeptidase-transglycosylase [Pseudohaliea rubra DSM 19751]
MTFLRRLTRLALLGSLGLVWLLAGVYLYLGPGLPEVETLRDVQLQTPMRVYTADGELIGQFGEQKRNPLAYDNIPSQFIDALLAAEDDGFFEHGGIDFMGLARAVTELLMTGQKRSGGSTLTMQVARNYFLSLERTFLRKFKEILLAIEIERRLSKEEIFELYFNRVFLGHRAYGFEAAAQVYYGKGIGELTLAQHAMLAGIPKAPSRDNPLSGPEAGRERRNWILGRMLNLGYIDRTAYEASVRAPVTADHYGPQVSFDARYVAEMARKQMLERFGSAAYTAGYEVHTTLRSDLQRVAQRAVIAGLRTYDRRHGYRGPELELPVPETLAAADAAEDPNNLPPAPPLPRDEWLDVLAELPAVAGLTAAAVTTVDADRVHILLADGSEAVVLWENGLRQARPYLSENAVGGAPESPAEVLSVGDVIRVDREGGAWHLAQVPAAQAALVSLAPDDGAILSLVGGIGFELSKFNRATQAERQPGSNFKPFLYAAALDAGYTAASIINDAPIVMEDASLEGLWRPENDGGKFYGPTRLRWALTKSRNLVSIRLLRQLGVRRLIAYAGQLGFDTGDFAPDLSLALGTHAMAPLELAAAYAVLANGGYRVEPYLIARVDDSAGNTVWAADPPRVCRDCAGRELSMEEILAGENANGHRRAERVMDERVNFILDDMLQDVITRGTGRRALALKRKDLAGKTGTTNGPMDAWFSGYNRDVVTTTWVGFDAYTPLGRREFGGTAALPIWIDFMRAALADSPDRERPVPAGIASVRIDPQSGRRTGAGDGDAIFEYFREENVPASTEDGSENTPGKTGTDELIRDIF